MIEKIFLTFYHSIFLIASVAIVVHSVLDEGLVTAIIFISVSILGIGTSVHGLFKTWNVNVQWSFLKKKI